MTIHLSFVLTLTTLRRLLLLLLRLGLVHLVEKGQAGGLELVGLLLELLSGSVALSRLVLGNELTERSDLLSDLVSLSLVEAVLELLEGLFSVVQDTVGTVGSLNGGLALLVLSTVFLSVLNHGLDLGIRETRAGSNGDGLVLVGGLVLGVNVDNGVGVNVERDFDLRNTTVGRRDANQLEVTKQLVVLDKLTLTLVHLNLDSSLEVSSGGESLRLLGGDGGVAVDQTSEDTTEGLDTERQGSNVKQENVSDLTGQDSTLDSGTDGNSLVGVDGLGGVTAEHAFNGLGNLGHTGHTTNQDDVLDVAGLKVGVLKGLTHRLGSTVDQGVNKAFELASGHLLVDVLSTASISSDERQVDLGLERRRQFNLSLLGSLTDTLDGHAVTGEIEARILLEGLDNVAHKTNIKVLTTQVSVTVGGLDFEDTLLNLQNGDVEGTTTKVEDGDNTVSLLLQTVGKSGSSGLVYDTKNVKTGDLTGVLGGLTLGVVEVGGDSDDSVLHGLAEVVLGSLLHLLEGETTNLRRRVLLATSLNPSVTVGVLDDLIGNFIHVTLNLGVGELATDETLSGKQSVLGVDHSLTLGSNPNQALTILSEGNSRGCCSSTYIVRLIYSAKN